MAPFFVLVVWCLWQMRWDFLNISPKNDADYMELLGVLYWSTSGFDSASTIAGTRSSVRATALAHTAPRHYRQPPSSPGEVESPERTLPRALAFAVVAVVVCTGLPLLVAAGNDEYWRCWEEGSINTVMAQLCGPWLGAWALISSAVCRTGSNPWTRSRRAR